MAKKSKTPAKETKAKAAEKATPKFGVNELVEATGLKAASVRVALRELGVEKNFGNQYGWDTKKDFETVVKAMKERSAKRVGAGEKTEKPAEKKTAAKKTAMKKTSKKKAA